MLKTGTMKPALTSYDQLDINPDGSADLYFGPAAPEGKQANWLQTAPGKGWFAYFRWYGPTQAFFDKTWQLPDITSA